MNLAIKPINARMYLQQGDHRLNLLTGGVLCSCGLASAINDPAAERFRREALEIIAARKVAVKTTAAEEAVSVFKAHGFAPDVQSGERIVGHFATGTSLHVYIIAWCDTRRYGSRLSMHSEPFEAVEDAISKGRAVMRDLERKGWKPWGS